MTCTTFILDIDGTLANFSHREHLLKEYCVACGCSKSIFNHVTNARCCVSCDGEQFTIPPKAWKAFTNPSVLQLDTPFAEAQAVVEKARNSKGVEIHYITGRHEGLREVTQDWLKRHYRFDSTRSQLLMRPREAFDTNSREVASVYKERQFLKLREQSNNKSQELFLFFDDDPYVLKMYSKYGVIFSAPLCWSAMAIPSPGPAELSLNK
jgi:predicted secreted acid phosphatase